MHLQIFILNILKNISNHYLSKSLPSYVIHQKNQGYLHRENLIGMSILRYKLILKALKLKYTDFFAVL